MRKIIIFACVASILSFDVGTASGGEKSPYTYEELVAALGKANRVNFDRLNKIKFDKITIRKAEAMKILEDYLVEKFGHADQKVMRAFREVPREFFHYHYETKRHFASHTYEPEPKPWAIGFGSALSDYLGQAYMTQLAKLKKTDIVLEVGTGSGYQVSLLSRIVDKAYSIEIIKPLGQAVKPLFPALGYDNMQTRVGDGFFGWPEVEGGFDLIMFTCSTQFVPPPIFEQLKPNGRLIVPIGQPFKRGQVLYVYTKDASGKIHSRKDMGVYFIPMTGEIDLPPKN